MKTRITELLGIDIPVVQAPMGYIARAQLASAVSNAGGMGIIETSSGQLDEIKVEIAKMRDLTDRPWGVNIAQMLMPDATVIDFVIEHDVRFVTTSAGDPRRFTSMLTDAGITVFHVVPTLRGALKAVDAGVDGLIVEGVEGGGFKNARGSSTMVLTPTGESRGGGAGDRCGRYLRRCVDGRRANARRRRCTDGHADAVRFRVAGTRQLETGGNSGRRDRHGVVEPIRTSGHAGVANRADS